MTKKPDPPEGFTEHQVLNEDTDLEDLELPATNKIHLPRRIYARNQGSHTRYAVTYCGLRRLIQVATYGKHRERGYPFCRSCERNAEKDLGFNPADKIHKQHAQGENHQS